MLDFTGEVVVVTGAGRGLGRLYALELARRGAAVVVNDVGGSMQGNGTNPAIADQVVAEIQAAGGMAVASHGSVDSPGGGRAIVDAAVDTFGRLDAVVSNAGIFKTRPFEDLLPSDWRRMIEVHLHGAFFLAQPAFGIMRRQGHGRFVFVASSAGLFGQPNSAHYAAAKAGVVGLANTIAIEGAEHGILANTVLPFGYTRMVTETVGGGEGEGGGNDEELRDDSAFLRAIEPELVVPIVVFLASRSCPVTHHNVSACAGRFARAFVGLGEGWLAPPGTGPTAEDVAARWDTVAATDPYTVPTSIFDEVAGICDRLGLTT
jgi:NAD(P)-dependent dehydrogenase (short-subunit alcohol dehydrogenase family)